MDKGYKRIQKNFNENGISGVPHDRAPVNGPVKPCNCKQPCPYGNGKTFCWPCYKKLMKAHRAERAMTNMMGVPAM